MNSFTLDSRRPVAVAYAQDGGKLAELLDGLECREFRVVHVSNREDLAEATRSKYKHLGAFIIEDDRNAASLSELIDDIDPGFRDSGGPVIVVVDSEADYDEDTLLQAGASKVFESKLGQRTLRLITSIEIEEFGRIRLLRTELQKRASAIGQIVKGQFRFKTRREAQNLATMLSMTCPNPMPIAIGLTELFINGVEHGCLGIGHNEKGQLIEEGRLAEEIENRRSQPEYADRYVTVDFRREPNRLFFEIKDGGEGFDYRSYVGEAEGHSKKHGRGIMMAKGCFEELVYKGNGNEVHAVHFFGE